MNPSDELDTFLRSPVAVREADALSGRLLHVGAELDGYRVLAFLGHGATGEVWRVREIDTGGEYALKIFAPADHCRNKKTCRARFLSEARILAQLEHPNLVRVFAFGRHHETPYFIMPVLRALPETRSERLIAALVSDLCAALAYLHAQGIVHRDLKLDNVLIASDGRFVLGDLGIAHLLMPEAARRFQETGEHNPTLVDGPKAIGTPGYAAPEQLTGQDITPRTDIHALGVLIERLFNGKVPFVWRLLILAMTSSLPGFRLARPRSVIRAVRFIRLRRMLGVGLLVVLLGAGVGMAVLLRKTPDVRVDTNANRATPMNEWQELPYECKQIVPAATPPPTKAIRITLPKEGRYLINDCYRPGPVTVRIGGRLEYRRVDVIISGPGTLRCPKIVGANVRLENGAKLITRRDPNAKETNMFVPIFNVSPDSELIEEGE